MRPFERRAANAYPFFKLAVWDDRNCTWHDGKRAHLTEEAAHAEATAAGQYRISRVDESGRIDLVPFQV